MKHQLSQVSGCLEVPRSVCNGHYYGKRKVINTDAADKLGWSSLDDYVRGDRGSQELRFSDFMDWRS